jgi:ubiquinone/menaquinone biosynthesis C-methylase UbiE
MQNLVHGIKGKVVVITGASSGIGEATAVMLAEGGAKVVLGARGLDRPEARLVGTDALRLNTPMNPNKALWEKGDFTRIAETMRASGEALVQRLGITKGLKVLDLGCGDGTTALPAAKLGADVLGVDIAQNLVEAGNKRATEQGLTNCKFQEGDASNLQQVLDHSFDLVVSIFGAMFAPKPFEVANEMVRVTRPGGRIVIGNWIPNDPTLVAQILKISSSYTPPPPEGFVSPMTWGIESNVIEWFAGEEFRQRRSLSPGTPLPSTTPVHRQPTWMNSGITTGQP